MLLLLLPQHGAAHGAEGAHKRGGSEHARSDAYYAAIAKDFEPFVAPALAPPAPEDLITTGSWGPVLPWPHIPVSAASLPDGRLLTYAASQGTDSPEGPEYTVAAVWDPVTGVHQNVDHDQHDMFCGHLVTLEDGRGLVTGGRNTVALTSLFDFQTDQWTLGDSMHRGRWYPTSVYLPDGDVFIARGLDGGDNPERLRSDTSSPPWGSRRSAGWSSGERARVVVLGPEARRGRYSQRW